MKFLKHPRGVFQKRWLIKSLRIIKLTFIIVLISCMQVSAKSYLQTVTLNLKSVNLKNALATIEKHSDFRFLYSAPGIANTGNVNINVINAGISEVMDQLLTDTRLTYKDLGNNLIVLIQKNELVQDVIVRGEVTDEATGKPLAGVSIQIKGSNAGTSTDANGNYSINVPEKATLLFSSVGYDNMEMPVNGQTVINISLGVSTTGLNEVLVVGYGTTQKKDLTSAITTVNTKLLDNRSLTNLSTALEGLTPGVYIQQQNGRPGQSGASSFIIRGGNLSTFSNNPPLVLIDGVEDDIDDINPADIASTSILKDAAAAAIYGARASGGVVLITTKRGSAGKLSVAYNGAYGLQMLSYGWGRGLKSLNTETWMKAQNEAAQLDGNNDVYTAAQIAQYTNSTDSQFPSSSQWMDWIPRSTPQQTHNISIRGGSKEISYFLSGGLLEQGGFIPHDNYSRKNALLNVDYHHNRLKISANVAYIRGDHAMPTNGGQTLFTVIRGAFITPPIVPFYNSNGTYNTGNPTNLAISGGTTTNVQDNLRMSLTLDYEILKGLFLDITTATKLTYGINNILTAKFPLFDLSGNTVGYNTSNTSVQESWLKKNYVNNQFLLNYTKNIGQHNFHIMGGITYEDEYDQNIAAKASQFPNNDVREISGTTGSGSQISGTSTADEWAINSVIGRLNYSYKDKYLFQATARYDGSSRFSPDHKWGFFPSFSGAWRINQEPFLKNVNFISDLKLRASWGQLGNQGSNLYPFAQAVSFGSAAFGNGLTSAAILGGPVNLALTWEKQTSVNLGLDFGFLAGRLSGSFDYFKERTKNIIGNPPVASTFGATSPLSNLYTIDMRGFEFAINWRDHIGAFSYFAGFNLSNSVDKVVNLAGLGATNNSAVFGPEPVVIINDGEQYMQLGKARNQWYLLRTDGLFTSQDQLDKSATQTSVTRPGDIHFVDANGDGVINSNDTRPLGKTSTPHYFFGANLGITFKNFDLSAVINGVWERWDLRNGGGTYLAGFRPGLNVLQVNYDHRWTTENPDQWAKVPRLNQNNWIGDLSNLFQDAEFWMTNFGYLRVKNIQIGYTLPKGITDKWSITAVRFYITGENLFTYKPGYIEPVDPEAYMNYDEEGSPFFGPNKLITFGVKVTL